MIIIRFSIVIMIIKLEIINTKFLNIGIKSVVLTNGIGNS